MEEVVYGEAFTQKFRQGNYIKFGCRVFAANNTFYSVAGIDGDGGLNCDYRISLKVVREFFGGGGMNKINLPEEKLARYHNPKIPQDYISRIDTILQQKDEIFSILREIREQNP